MCTPECIIEKLGCLAFDEAVKAGKYVLYYAKNLGDLQDEMRKLNDRRECIHIQVREAIDNGKEIMPDVKTWQMEADKLKNDVDQLMGESTAKGNMHCIACSCPNIKWRYRLSKQAEKKKQEVKELTEKGHFKEIAHRRPPPLELQFPSNDYYVNLDSRTSIFNSIVDALIDSRINIIGVHGPGGVGKTTLVKEVWKKMLDDRIFKNVSLAVVSKDLNVKDIQAKLADSLYFEEFEATAEEKRRASQLWNKLTNGEKYLIILDDIWEEVDLKAIGIPLMNGKTGCKVVLTSRNEDLLVNRMKVDIHFPMAELLEAEAWDVFKKRVGNSIKSQPEMESLAKKVCKKCKGLPVALNALGAALKDKPDYAWKDALNKLESCMLTNIPGIKPSVWVSLRVSYDMLSSSDAKCCFLLCCLFRDDVEISIDDLTRHCLAGRLLSENPRTLEEVRNSVRTMIDDLKSASLLSNGSHENVVRIHDIIRDVGISIAREEKAFFVGHGAWPKNPIYSAISLISEKIEELPTELTCPKLHTLMLDNSNFSDLEVPDEFFSGMTQLSVLIVTRIGMLKLPSSLGKLANLRMLYMVKCDLEDIDILGDLSKNLEVLSLRGSSIKELPPKIGQLISLRVLDLEECYELNVIPRDVVSNLTNLEELYFPSTFFQWEAAIDKKHNTNSSNNVRLEELRRSLTRGQLTVLHIHIPKVMPLPEGLKFENLKRFKVSVGSTFERNEDFRGTRVFKHDGLSIRNEFIPLVDKAEVLYLSGIKGLKKVLHDTGDRNAFLDLKYLKVTSCDDDLEYLIGEPKSSVQSHVQNPLHSFNKLTVLLIEKCKLKYPFSPTTARGLPHLEQLKVSSCEIMEGIVGFEGQNDVNEHVSEVKFGKLKQLELENLPNLISFYAKKEKTRTTTGRSSAHPQPLFNEKVIFPILERLDIRKMGNLIEIWDKQPIAVLEEQGTFCQLLDVNVDDCAQLTHVFPSGMHELLKNLKVLAVTNCGTMKGIVEFEGELDEDEPKNGVCFSKLIELKLWRLPNLVSFCTKLETVGTTDGNATIRALPLFNEKVIFPVLERLDIRTMDNLTEIWDKQSIAALKEQGSFCQLMDVNVCNCAQLTHVFPSKMHAPLKNLKELDVRECGTMNGIVEFEGEIEVCFNQLSTLRLWSLPNLESFCTELRTAGTTNGNATILAQPLFNEKVAFPALEDLTIHEVPNITEIWDKKSLPESEKETPSFGRLRDIEVRLCNQLVYVLPCYMLPQLQIKLQSLEIWGCEEVEVIVSKELKEKEATENEIIVFQKLKGVHFGYLRKLKSFYTGTELLFSDKVVFPSLESLNIKYLPEIKEIWPYKQPLPEPGNEAESFYKLSYIRVEGCQHFVYVFPFYILRQLQHLEVLHVLSCEKLEVIVSKELKEKEVIHNDIVFPQLKTVRLVWLPNLKRICSETQLFFSDKDAFPVLKEIVLNGENLEFLRNGTSTKVVSMEECGTSGKENDHNDGEED